MSELIRRTIERPCTSNVGVVAANWPDDIQRYVNTREREIRDEFGYDAIKVVDACDGSHGRFTVRRTMFFEARET